MTPFRTGTALAALALLAAGCTDSSPAGLDDAARHAPLRTEAAVALVLNTQLRGIIDPEIEPSPAWGHVQLRLSDAGEDGYRAEWRGRLFNPDGESWSTAAIINPDIVPAPGDGGVGGGALVLSLFRDAAVSCPTLVFDSQGTDPVFLSPEVAAGLMADPSGYAVVAVSDQSAVVGRFGLPDPTTILGFNPQPDPPGRVACGV